MIVIGTAGHIDHGKSAIVKRLTGTNPDRLPEELKRGMTIDLGFAFMINSDGEDVAFVDVPGHEKFVRNMIAGAGGVDAVMLVIAADDGWMPQSQEHFQITRLLGVKRGLIVINKSDLADDDWLDLLEDDIREKTKDSYLDGARIIRISAETGDGFDLLKSELTKLASEIKARQDYGKARLYIDRSFIRTGMGGVVTGTLRGGSLSVGQTVSVWPSLVSGKVRTVQSAGHDVETASPGQRTAISLTGVDKEQLERGGVISDFNDLSYFNDNNILALHVEVLPESPVSLTDRRRGLLLVGTSECEGEMRIFDSETIGPGGSGVLFFRPDDPLYTLVGDRFIVRLPTPMVTVGGGTVLDHIQKFPRRRELTGFKYLKERINMTTEALVLSELTKLIMADNGAILSNADISPQVISSVVDQLVEQGKVKIFDNYIYAPAIIEQVSIQLTNDIERLLSDSSHLKGLTLEQIRKRSGHESFLLRSLLALMIKRNELTMVGELYNRAGRSMALKGKIKQAYEEIISQLNDNPYAPPAMKTFASKGKEHQVAIKYILDTNEGYKVGSEFLFLTTVWDEILLYIREQLNQAGRLTLADLRERFSFSRKFVIPILEETDRLGLTARSDDCRVKGNKFA